MAETFLFVSLPRDIQIFEEGRKKPFARVEVLACELDKVSENGNLYAFQDAEIMMASLVGKGIYYGITQTGEHLKPNQTIKIGFVESARIVGRKIMAVLNINDDGVISSLKAGMKNFLCSVGGVADKAKLVVEKTKKFIRMIRPRCTHLQFWQSSDPNDAGFTNAGITKVLEFQESALLMENTTVEECDIFGCRVLAKIRRDYEYEESKRKTIREIAKRKAINRTIAQIISLAIKEPWRFIEKEES